MKPPLIPKILQPTSLELPGGRTQTPLSAQNCYLKHTNTHTWSSHLFEQCSQTASCHTGGGGCLADRVECLFPSTTGGTALVTHTHSCTLANMHPNPDNAPIIGWTEREGHRVGAVSAFSPILTFHLDTLEYKHFIM